MKRYALDATLILAVIGMLAWSMLNTEGSVESEEIMMFVMVVVLMIAAALAVSYLLSVIIALVELIPKKK